MTLDEQAREVVERLNDIRAAHPVNRQVELDVIAAALRQQWEEAAKQAEEEGLAAHLPLDRWDQGYRKAATNIATALRQRAQEGGG